MEESAFKAERITRTYRQTIGAPPDRVFPLVCPVREADWLDGWRYSMIYSRSGLMEPGAVFSTPRAGEPDTTWVVTKHDPGKGEVEFVRFTPGSRTCVLGIIIRASGEGSSFVDISYTYTATAPAGNAFIAEFSQEAFLEAVMFWEKSMNHYLKTGRRLRKAGTAG